MRSLQSFKPYLLICLSILLVSCNTTPPPTQQVHSVTSNVPVNSGPPDIKGIVDLGGLDIQFDIKTLPKQFSDKRFSPGEWILIKGKNLGSHEIKIDENEIIVDRYYDNQPLIRIPTGLSPLKKHHLSITNQQGTDEFLFHTQHYIVATDTDGKKTHLIRTDATQKGGIEEEWQALKSDADRPMFNLISNDSLFLFTINIDARAEVNHDEDTNSFILEIMTYHLAASNKPELIATTKVEIGSSPIDAILSSDNQLALLGKNSLTLIDANQPTKLKELAHLTLPKNARGKTTFIDVAFVDENRKLAALEIYSNKIYLLDLTMPTPTIIHSLALLPDKTIPLSIDIEVNPSNSNELWVLQGSNYRLISKHLSALYKKTLRKKVISDDQKPVSQLQKVTLTNNRFQTSKSIKIEGDYAYYYSSFGTDGRLYISATKLEWLISTNDQRSDKNLVEKIGNKIWDAVSIGRIIAVDLNSSRIEPIASGVGIYYHLILVPDIGPVFTLAKIGASPLGLLFVQPYWGVGIKSTGTYAKRKMDKHAIFPPYSLGFIAYQH